MNCITRTLGLCTVAVCLLLASTGAQGAGFETISEVEAKGASPIEKGQLTQARERALHDAMRRAVEAGVGVLIGSESATRDGQLLADRIYAKAEGYVERYDILGEKEQEGVYHVTITARVRKADLANSLVDLLVLDQQMDMPQLMVLMSDGQGGYGDS